MEAVNSQEIFNNHVILENILKFMYLNALKNVRHVNKLWAITAPQIYNSTNIYIKLSLKLPASDFAELANFVLKNRIKHTLFVSFMTPPWYYYNFHEDCWKELHKSFHDPKSTKFNSQKLEIVNKILDCVLAIQPFSQELRLEMNLMDEIDAKLLKNVLARCQTATRFSLNFISYSDEGILSVNTPTTNNLLPNDSVFGISFFHGQCSITTEIFSNFMRGFLNVKFIELRCWDKKLEGSNCVELKMLVDVILKIGKEWPIKSFTNLKGIRTGMGGTVNNASPMCLLANLVKLKHIYIGVNAHDREVTLPQIREIMELHGEALESFDLEWNTGNGSLPFRPSVLPIIVAHSPYPLMDFPLMPNLKSLGLQFPAKLDDANGWTLETLDPFGIRKLFLESVGNNLQELPSLTTLCISFYFEQRDEIWEYIFPDKNNSGHPIKITSVKNLMISLMTDCDSPKIKRLIDIFPSLKLLRHVKKYEASFVICDHRFPANYTGNGNIAHKNEKELREYQIQAYHPIIEETKVEDWTGDITGPNDITWFHQFYEDKMYYLLRGQKTMDFNFF